MREGYRLIVGVLIGVISAMTIQAIADQNPDTDDVPRIIPYQGVLEFDGVAWDASSLRDNVPLIEFDIFDGADLATRVYCERRTVEVFNGRFTALLGDANGRQDCADAVVSEIGDVVRNADDLYLKATLIDPFGDDPAQRVALSNAQRLLPAPYALWSTSATNFTVSRDLAVGGNANLAQLNVAGELNAQDNLNVAGALDVVGDMALGGDITTPIEALQGATFQGDVVLDTNGSLYLTNPTDAAEDRDGALVIGDVDGGNLNFDGNEIMARSAGNPSTLFLNHNPSNNGALVDVGGSMRVRTSLTVNDNLTVDDNLTVGGTVGLLRLGLQIKQCDNNGNGDLNPADSTIECQCPAGTNLIAGGGQCINNHLLKKSLPEQTNSWEIICDGTDNGDGGASRVRIMCGRITID